MLLAAPKDPVVIYDITKVDVEPTILQETVFKIARLFFVIFIPREQPNLHEQYRYDTFYVAQTYKDHLCL